MRRSVIQVTLSYSLKYLRYLAIPLSIGEFARRTLQNLTIMHYTFQHSLLMQYWDRVKREERES